VAAGSSSKGFWLAFPENPTGPSKTNTIWPRRTPLGEFSGNVSHSSWDGLMVDRGPTATLETESAYYDPRLDPSNEEDANPPVVAEFKNFTAYKHHGNAIWLRGQNHKVIGAKLADNAVGVTFASDKSVLEDSLLVGDSANKGFSESWEPYRGADGRSIARPYNDEPFPVRGFEFYDGQMGFKNVQFINFQPLTLDNGKVRESGAMSYLRFTAFPIDSRNFAQGARFTNAKAVYFPPRLEPSAAEIAEDENADGYRAGVFVDIDGSVGGQAGRAIVFNNPFLVDANCSLKADWNAQVCANTYGRMYFENVSKEHAIAPLALTRDAVTFRMWGSPDDGNNTHFGASVILGRAYTLAPTGGMPNRLRISLRDSTPSSFVRLSVPFTGTAYVYPGYYVTSGSKISPAASLTALEASTKNAFFQEAGTLHLKLALAANQTGNSLEVCRTDLCK
jgi:cell surface hyaluronidase